MNNTHRIPMSIMQLSQSGLLPKEDEKRPTPAAGDGGLKTYKLPPEEVEMLLQAQYGRKLEAVKPNTTGKEKQRNSKQPAFY